MHNPIIKGGILFVLLIMQRSLKPHWPLMHLLGKIGKVSMGQGAQRCFTIFIIAMQKLLNIE
jgi:hypothetical protein